MTSKYDPLRAHLEASTEALVRLTFAQIERILGAVLPASATKHPAWWANEEVGTHGHARAWLEAGFRTQALDLNARRVEFARVRPASRRSTSEPSPPSRAD